MTKQTWSLAQYFCMLCTSTRMYSDKGRQQSRYRFLPLSSLSCPHRRTIRHATILTCMRSHARSARSDRAAVVASRRHCRRRRRLASSSCVILSLFSPLCQVEEILRCGKERTMTGVPPGRNVKRVGRLAAGRQASRQGTQGLGEEEGIGVFMGCARARARGKGSED